MKWIVTNRQLRRELRAAERTIETLGMRIAGLKMEHASNRSTIRQMFAERDATIASQRRTVTELQDTLATLHRKVVKHEDTIARLRANLAEASS